MRVADLTQISWEVIKEWMVWYASFERKGPTKEKPREKANHAKENGDRRPRCHWCQRRGHFINKCRDKAAGKPRVPPPEQSGSPPPQQQQHQQQSSGLGSQSSGSSGSGQQGQK
uniref:CCHC-type domain-containing protein n=1 Tax=Chromera velia CCMP2878 TaxID=1169474 RepID=A0A0G4I165_9ALVE|eukprot:Cvel_1653.t1-p1 / transcript=Cvel_1653.t1 / gene=Cvel_1653 / organism=Chromera_velia_CCMP2878 / gene_product=hypothetical protein / transcript_product=hypothetical protein / location=Cvel_scaffold59:117253-117591(+) / protein_length=113 / sequence_SO=supercontig / SO=protein_coding / is_pseudo=false